MKIISRIFSVLIITLFAQATARAQSLQPTVIASDGGFFSSGSGSISWTLGEPISETYTSTNNILTQGFHQPYGLFISGIPGGFSFGPFVYPNPALEHVNVSLVKMPVGEYTLELFDALGKKLTSAIAPGGDPSPFSIPVSEFANGVYMLKISGKNFDQSFRIIKTK